MEFLKYAQAYQEQMVSDLMDLCSIDSLLDEENKSENAPFGPKVREALDWMFEKGQSDGFNTKDLEGYAGIISYGQQQESISILGHLDVVPANPSWQPFNPKIVDGYIVARGSTDDKGPTIAAYYALKILKDLNISFKHRIDMILGCDEETGMRCMQYYKSHEKLPLMGIVPDADFPVIYGEKGILNFDIILKNTTSITSMHAGSRPNIVIDEATCQVSEPLQTDAFEVYSKSLNLEYKILEEGYSLKGRAFHASLPHYGNNAAMHLLSFIGGAYNNKDLQDLTKALRNVFGDGVKISNESASMGPLTMNLGIVNINSQEIRLTMDIRYPIESNSSSILDSIKHELPFVQIQNIADSKPLYVQRDSDLVQTCLKAYQKITGDTQTPPKTMGGGTYARTLPNHVAFGADFPLEKKPEWVGGPHEINEAISIEALVNACAIYCETLYNLAVDTRL